MKKELGACTHTEGGLTRVDLKRLLMCVNRAIGQNRGGHGPDQRGHARSREESVGDGEMLRHLCPSLQQVRTAN